MKAQETSVSPPGWVQTTLGAVLSVLRGVTYRKDHAVERPLDGYVPILRATNIQAGLTFEDLVYVPERYVGQNQLLRTGDIVIAASSGSRAVVGKAAALTHPWRGSFGAFCFGLRPAKQVRAQMVAYYLQGNDYRERVARLSAGVNINNLKREHIESCPFLLPPSREQGRIVGALDALFTRLEAAAEALRRVQANLERYRASVLKAACEGRLVPTEAELARAEGRDYEPASRLLERIFEERRTKWKLEHPGKKQLGGALKRVGRSLPPHCELGTQSTSESGGLPEGWLRVCFDALVIYVTSGSRGWAKYYSVNGPLFLRIGNLEHDSIRLDLRCVQRVQPPVGSEGRRTLVTPGDVLISITADLGMVALVPEDIAEAYINQHIALVRTVGTIDRRYLAWYLASKAGGRMQFRKMQRGATKTGLGLDDIRAIAIPLPPVVEQRRIVAAVERRFSVIDELEAAVEANLKRSERLKQSILKRAFEGKLVPQDPKDEPASVLLERIKAERAAGGNAVDRSWARKPKQDRFRRKTRGLSGKPERGRAAAEPGVPFRTRRPGKRGL